MLSFRAFLAENSNRLDFIKKQNPNIDMSHDGVGHRTLQAMHTMANPHLTDSTLQPEQRTHALIDHIAKHDPSPNNAYTQWMVNQYKKKTFRLEDLPRLKDTLQAFHENKGKLKNRDINQYKTHQDVHDAVKEHLEGIQQKNAQFPDGPRFENHPGATKIHDDGKGTTIHLLHSHAAGRAARDGCGHKDNTGGWCFGWKDSHHFDNYSEMGPIHLIQTPDNKKYALHFPTGQLMDKDDRSVNPEHLVKKYPQLKGLRYDMSSNDAPSPEFIDTKFAFVHPRGEEHIVNDIVDHGNADEVQHLLHNHQERLKPHHTDTLVDRHEHGEISNYTAVTLPHLTQGHIDHLWERTRSHFSNRGLSSAQEELLSKTENPKHHAEAFSTAALRHNHYNDYNYPPASSRDQTRRIQDYHDQYNYIDKLGRRATNDGNNPLPRGTMPPNMSPRALKRYHQEDLINYHQKSLTHLPKD